MEQLIIMYKYMEKKLEEKASNKLLKLHSGNQEFTFNPMSVVSDPVIPEGEKFKKYEWFHKFCSTAEF